MQERVKKVMFGVLFLVSLSIFIYMTINVVNKNTADFDGLIYSFVAGYISPLLTGVMVMISFLGSGQFLIAFSLILIVIFWGKEKYSFFSAMVAINLLLSAVLNYGVKLIIQRSRPDVFRLIEISGFSYPSGHSMAAMSFFGFLIYLCRKIRNPKWKYFFISLFGVVIVLIGISRIYLGVHYFSDVIGGFSLGLAWVILFSAITGFRYKKKYCR